ncbi:MAG: glycogen synthase GlgA [Candidatus Lambdaproteobacteria bacterium]|nr:glycogen synthase GlgA [Candidatus Lambdaproteobacteria bacterium]
MRILSVASEVYPLVKTGGLADVAGALPAALAALGEDVRILVPGYPAVLDATEGLGGWLPLGDPLGAGECRLGLGRLPGTTLRVWVIECPTLYGRPGNPYSDAAGADWPDNHLRFALLARVAALVCEAGALLGWPPDLLHAHDWQAGLAPAYLALRAGRRPATVFTIHNIQFPGIFPAAALPALGLPRESYSINGVEYHGNVSFLKAGLYYADHVNTVSPTYALELLTPEGGSGFHGALAAKGDRFSGILNGIDTALWNPARDAAIAVPFSAAALQGKAIDKAALQREAGLAPQAEAPLFGVISRLTGQKGMDLLVGALPELLAGGGQLVLLGTGERPIEATLLAAAQAHPRHVHVRIGYDEAFAHRIQAGSDALLVPSRHEPCGLTQLYAMRYGTLPVARRTGGLADSVVDAAVPGAATGFLFDRGTVPELAAAIRRASAAYHDPAGWGRLRERAMQQDFSWDASARRYLELFRSLA